MNLLEEANKSNLFDNHSLENLFNNRLVLPINVGK